MVAIRRWLIFFHSLSFYSHLTRVNIIEFLWSTRWPRKKRNYKCSACVWFVVFGMSLTIHNAWKTERSTSPYDRYMVRWSSQHIAIFTRFKFKKSWQKLKENWKNLMNFMDDRNIFAQTRQKKFANFLS